MRESQYRILREKLQRKLDTAARTMQQWVRAKLERKRFIQMRKAAVTIQVGFPSHFLLSKTGGLSRLPILLGAEYRNSS